MEEEIPTITQIISHGNNVIGLGANNKLYYWNTAGNTWSLFNL